MMDRRDAFTAEWMMSDIIDAAPDLLTTMSRFGLSLGFGEKRVGEVCTERGVDCPTFLRVCNFIAGRRGTGEVSVAALVAYLKAAHVYFLAYALPDLRRRLIEAIDCADGDGLGVLILRFFDKYTAEVRRHMGHEDRRVFAYVDRVLEGRRPADYSIQRFAAHHQSIHEKLQELKRLIIRYYAPPGRINQLNAVLLDVIRMEQDLEEHCRVEDRLFVPAVARLEQTCVEETPAEPDPEPATDALTAREKEIVRCVALGLSNKEIADRMALSVHTVATHRRNIAAKLNIHSPAGLAIYAVVNGLIDPKAVRM